MEGNEPRKCEILVKKDCLIKDYIVMKIIQLADIILKREEQMDFYIQTYRVLPVTPTSGLIEIVPKAKTLYEIQYRMNFSVLNFIFEHNPTATISKYVNVSFEVPLRILYFHIS